MLEEPTADQLTSRIGSETVGFGPTLSSDDAQELLCQYFLDQVQTLEAIAVIEAFKKLLFLQQPPIPPLILEALEALVLTRHEPTFRYTLTRICFCLINNWQIQRQRSAIGNFLGAFSDPILSKSSASRTRHQLRQWLKSFTLSQTFQELQLYKLELDGQEQHWTNRYRVYLLAAQYGDDHKPKEQRQAAQALARQMRERFKFELAMYTAFGDRNDQRRFDNPTALGDDVLSLVRKILGRRGAYSYKNLAQIFLDQSVGLRLEKFKLGLLRYLTFTVSDPAVASYLQQQLSPKLMDLYQPHHPKVIDGALQLRIANRLIDYLTVADQKRPTDIFCWLMCRGDALTPAVLLLRIVLMSPHSKAHMEMRTADLLRHYSLLSEADCKIFVRFLEVLRIASTIYLENVDYSWLRMTNPQTPQAVPPATPMLDGPYRLFSACRAS